MGLKSSSYWLSQALRPSDLGTGLHQQLGKECLFPSGPPRELAFFAVNLLREGALS